MATKTFKIGEYSRGGVITAEVKKNKVTVIFKEWDFSTGSRRSSNQKNAKELYRVEVDVDANNSEQNLMSALYDDTTSYYADMIMKWIKTKVSFKYTCW